ncbi:hypothetical protein THAOC_36897 [Thalassiosira oceanica]|uniref:Uncharacterized protein n=1 Tax=Thalassiosira oceanica TaxID=159749 RepID=K0R775_THAOC|nr:hypothetical protein THAOC_36897 [Thalassiosira oceanica]|eukprot:EJK44551.1 hypothetical protein THAOC_36897 [Thalassiosira oceanica]
MYVVDRGAFGPDNSNGQVLYARPNATTSPLGVDLSAHLQRDYSNLSGSVGSAGTTMIGRVELLYGLPPGGPMTAPMDMEPLFTPNTNTSPMMCCGRRAIQITLWPTLSIKRSGATNGKFVHHRTGPACRGLGAVDNVTSIETSGDRS